MFENIEWTHYIEYLKTENILALLSSMDPAELAQNPKVIIPAIICSAAMIFFRFYRTLALIVGIIVLWAGAIYGLPDPEQELSLSAALKFGAVCIAVAGFWIYMFLIRAD